MVFPVAIVSLALAIVSEKRLPVLRRVSTFDDEIRPLQVLPAMPLQRKVTATLVFDSSLTLTTCSIVASGIVIGAVGVGVPVGGALAGV